MSDAMKENARQQIEQKGYSDPSSTDEAQQNLQKLKAMATGDSDNAKGMRDLADVMNAMFDKVKIAQLMKPRANSSSATSPPRTSSPTAAN